jgi:hypothetical protein
MSLLFQFEKNIEAATVDFLNSNGLNAFPGRNLETISRDSIECLFEYGGAIENPRSPHKGNLEYIAHTGTISLLISTTRQEGNDHNETLGLARNLFLNSNNGLNAIGVDFLDLLPLGSVTTEQEDENLDQTVLQYNLKFVIDLNAPTTQPAAPGNISINELFSPTEPSNVLAEKIPQGIVLGAQVRLLTTAASNGRNLPIGTIVEIVGGSYLSNNTQNSIHFKTDLNTGPLSQTWFSSITFQGSGWELV